MVERPCPECGLDTRSLSRASVPGHILRLGSAWSSVLTGAADRPASAPVMTIGPRWSTGATSVTSFGCSTSACT